MTVSYDFSGRTALVTGASKGIGRRIAERLRDAGAQVWVWDTAPRHLDGVDSAEVDVTNAEEVATATQRVIDQTSRLDIVVNNAGYLPSTKPFENMSPVEWEGTIGVNLIGMLNVCHSVVPLMRQAGKGRIINMGSLAGKDGVRNLSVYSAASAGVIAFTKALGRELAEPKSG
jgi:2-dehydro-3-deoxy-L-rhamnonate dehydrogenase (NAD+)